MKIYSLASVAGMALVCKSNGKDSMLTPGKLEGTALIATTIFLIELSAIYHRSAVP